MTFIDDFSRKVWIYLLKDKSKTFEAFKEFRQEAENDSGLKIEKRFMVDAEILISS